MRSGVLVAIVSIVLLAVPCAFAQTSGPARSAKASCKGTKVAIKVGRKKTCQPFSKLFPPPKDVDLRLSYLRQALKLDPAKLAPKKKRKRIHSLQSGFGAAGKRLQKKLLASLPRALAFFDRKRGGARPSSLLDRQALASANCGLGPASERGSLGGNTSVTLLGANGMLIETEAAGYTVRVSFVSCGGVDRFSVPECPKADGSVDANGTGDFRATTEIWKGSRLEERTSTNFEDTAQVHGEVGADAKLKLIKVRHKQEMLIISRKVGGAYRGGMERDIQIRMPGGQYDPASAHVKPLGDPVSADFGADAFRKTASAALSGYQSAEARWSSFDRRPFCAQAVFSPAADTIKVKTAENRQLGIHARAVADGGTATAARWSLTGPVNADFSPAASAEPAPTVQYTVSKTPQGNEVKVTARFTSTAGVGEDSWKQPIELGLPERFAATFSGTATYGETLLGEHNHLSADWSGNAELRQMPNPYPPGTLPYEFAYYKIVSGSITYGVNGALDDCAIEGGGPIDLPSQPDLKETPVLTIFDKTPREYSLLVGMPLFAKVPATLSGCEDPEEDGPIEGGFSPAIGVPAIVNAPLPGGPVGTDWSFSGNGSGDTGGGSPDQTWQWNLSPIG
jgi:hypothetical protein